MSVTPGDSHASTARGPERRQLTVMFCDLVGSTPLTQQLDPEDLREVIGAYRSTCLPVIEHYGGFVSRFMGDGLLVLFGYPTAHEDDAERAVMAGLGIIEAMHELNESLEWAGVDELKVRLGIATGLVIAGDRIGAGASEEDAIIGEPPNLAARLQSFAKPNCVVISDNTHHLLSGRFECEDLGRHDLKGFAAPQSIWKVQRPLTISSRFAAAHGSELPPLVDRKEELEPQLRLWEKARRGDGQVILIRGEPGIGKSRLAQELNDRVTSTTHYRIRYQCSPYYRNTALFPFIDQLSRAARFRPDDAPTERLKKLERLLKTADPNPGEALPLMASMLSVPMEDPGPLATMTPQRRREKTIETLITQYRGLCAQRPLLVIFEDLHWVDPTSRELIDIFVENLLDTRVLAVFTARPSFRPDWTEREHVNVFDLNRFEPRDGLTLIEQVAGPRTVPELLSHEILERTDGVPLFVEELTRTLLDLDIVSPNRESNAAVESQVTRAIPATLQDSLMARLDQLGAAKRVAQLGATIGRQFSLALLKALASRQAHFDSAALPELLQRLQETDLLTVHGTAPNLNYTFKHALVRDAAYDSLLKRQREGLHREIVTVLEEEFEETVETRPELLAYHCSEAQLCDKAVEYWLEAGRRAADASANVEAVSHLRSGLSLLPRVRDPALRKRVELDTRVALGAPLISTKGPGSSQVEKNYTRALKLCAEVPESKQHFEAHWGWWRVSLNHRIGRERGNTLLALAERLGDQGLLLQAHHCQWATRYHLGDHEACCRHAEAGLVLYEPQTHRHHASVYGGHDAKVCGHGEYALSLWLLGHPKQALRQLGEALAWAIELAHVGSIAHARDYELLLGLYRRDAAGVARFAERMIEFATAEKLPDYRERGLIFKGWALAQHGEARAGIELMSESLQRLRSFGTKEDLPMFLELLAQVYHSLGETDEGLECVQQAFEESEQAGLHCWLAELHRCRANLRLPESNDEEAEASLLAALEIAREQGALTFQLRAATDLARVYRGQGRLKAAADLLQPIFDRYDKDLETADLLDARALLTSLG